MTLNKTDSQSINQTIEWSNLTSEFNPEEIKVLNRLYFFLGFENVYHALVIAGEEQDLVNKHPSRLLQNTINKQLSDFINYRKTGIYIIGHLIRLIKQIYFDWYWNELNSRLMMHLIEIEFNPGTYSEVEYNINILAKISLHEITKLRANTFKLTWMNSAINLTEDISEKAYLTD